MNWDPAYINIFADLFGAKTVWAPFKRNCTKRNLGPFEPTEHIPYQSEWNPTYDANISNKNIYDFCCMVRKKGKYEPASCNGTHPRLCVYNTRSINCRTNCDQHDCFCIKNDTHNREKLCKSDNQKLKRNNFFPIESSCFFENINRNVTMLFDERGFGWKLSDDRRCSICQKKRQNGNISIRLRYVQNRNEIKLTITNSTKLLAVSCMTNAGADLVHIIYRIEYGNNTSSCNDSETTTTIKYTFSPLNRYSSHYWCMAFGRAHKIIKSNIIFVVPSDNSATGNDYAVIAEVEGYQNTDPYAQKDFGIEKRIRQKLNDMLDMIRPMQLLNYTQDKGTLRVLIHLTLKLNNNVTLLDEYNEVNTTLNGIKEVVNVRNSEVCLPDTTQSNNFTLRWPETRIGVTIRAHSDCLCLHQKTLSHYIPVMRKCEGNFLHGAYWGQVEGICSVDFVPSNVTNELHDLIKNSSVAPEKVTEKLLNITEENKDFMSYDIDMMSQILERVSGNTQVVNIVSNIMNFDREVLEEAQELLNSTDKILYVLDNLANDIEANNFTTSSKNLLVKVDEYNLENVIGIGIQENETFQHSKIKPLYKSSNVLEHDFSVAAFVESEHKEIQLSFTIFRDDILFNTEKKVNKSVKGRIISIVINDTAFVGKVFVLFKNSLNTDSERNCGYWEYGSKSLVDNIKGRWSLEEIQQQVNGSYTICEFDHLTHYAILVNDKTSDELGLDIATIVGTCLSFVGILGICLNAIVDYKWRQIPSSIVIVCFSITIGLQLILLYLADILKNYEVCVPIGIALHYTVLSEFCWMLVIAVLQYKRYVQVFYNHMNHLVAKSAIFSWGVPLPIVVTTYVIDPTTHKENPNLCYPSGIMLISFVISPVAVVLLINCIIFVLILKSICIRKTKAYGGKDNESHLQVLLGILLFFLLGISWVLGVAVALDGTMTFVMYLFTLTTSFQGFVIFMYFVLLNDKAKLKRYLISWSNKVLRRKTNVQSALFNNYEVEHSTKPYNGKQH